MTRTSLLCLVAAFFTTLAPAQQAPKKSALDKAALETYARHLWVLDPNYKLDISDPQPSTKLPGFREVKVLVSQGSASRELELLVSNDGSRIIQGSVYNINENPFKANIDKLKTQLQPSIGTPGAPVVLVVFSDMECPHCKVEAQMIRQNLLKAFPTQVRFYFKDFPLEQIHTWAKAAAIAGRCIFRQNPAAFWDYHDWVFEHQESITGETLKPQVISWVEGKKDVDALQLGKCMDTKATEKEVNANVEEARALGVDSTPTLFVNGREVPGLGWDGLKRIIDNEIEYQETAKDAGENCGCEVTLSAPGLPPKTAPVPSIKK